METSSYYENLIKKVIDSSIADTWDEAVFEWEIIDCEEDESCTSECLCGKKDIKYLYTIHNTYNNNILYYIGSKCIQKFGREDLTFHITILEQLYKLYHAIEKNKRIELNSDFFSRKLLEYLYEKGVLNTSYNHFDGTTDYLFLLKMYNKRNSQILLINKERKLAR